jgi:Flp pilus assembly protein CpaB
METNESAKWLKRIFILLCFPVVIGSILLTLTIVENISYMLDDSPSFYDTTKVIAANGELKPGDIITEDNIGVITMQNDELPAHYIPTSGFVAIRGYKIITPLSHKAPLSWYATEVPKTNIVITAK